MSDTIALQVLQRLVAIQIYVETSTIGAHDGALTWTRHPTEAAARSS